MTVEHGAQFQIIHHNYGYSCLRQNESETVSIPPPSPPCCLHITCSQSSHPLISRCLATANFEIMNPRSHNRTKILNFIDVSRISSIILLQTVERNKASVQSSPVLQIGTFSPRSPLINPERGEVRHRQFSPAHSVLKGVMFIIRL